MARLSLIAALVLAGCTGYPDLGPSPATRGAAYPRLIPLTALLARAETGQLSDPTLSRDLAARAQRLRARAATLRQNAVSEADLQRMRAALARQTGRTAR
jgi:hypothetical protein